jgi:phycoerythrin-associated linker protein
MALWITDSDPLNLQPGATEDDLQIIIRAVYRQVLGNAHVMDSQRLTSAESSLRNRDITVRDFVRAIAQSDLYRSRFFETSSPYRFIELNFKHLLGRAPQDQSEISQHVQIYNEQGYAAEINSYIDSAEYTARFGDDTVPYYQGSQTQSGIKNVGFNRTFALMRGYAANDIGNQAKLIGDVAGNYATKIVAPATGSGSYSNIGKRFRVSVSQGKLGARITQSVTVFEVGYAQLSARIQNIQKTGGRILNIAEVA